MGKWIDIGPASQFPRDEHTCLDAAGFAVVVCNAGGELRAIANVCPHAGLPLGEGELNGKVITCPFHGYAYNVETGQNIDDPNDLPVMRYPLRESEGRVEVELPIK